MRCTGCNKFASFEIEDPQVELEYDAEGQSVTGTLTLNLNCAECGELLKSADIEIASALPADIVAMLRHHCGEKQIEAEASAEDGGTPRKPAYDYTVTYSMECECGESIVSDMEVSGSILRAEMDEQV